MTHTRTDDTLAAETLAADTLAAETLAADTLAADTLADDTLAADTLGAHAGTAETRRGDARTAAGPVHGTSTVGQRPRLRRLGPLRRRCRDDRGSATAEYAVVILAAVAFAGVLVAVMRSGEVQALLTELVRGALSL